MPVVAPLVDDSWVKDDDLVPIEILLLDDHAEVPESLRFRVAARLFSFAYKIARVPAEEQPVFHGCESYE